jgi:hypothetical protein
METKKDNEDNFVQEVNKLSVGTVYSIVWQPNICGSLWDA